ncbi:MAG: bifunctional oligoribonuclease/PAP phosphatase NrnA [Candidatus Nanopelagicales bacterium]
MILPAPLHGSVGSPAWEALVEALQRARRVLLVSHVNPDADTLGSALAIALAFRADGRAAEVSFDAEPFAVPRALQFLPGADTVLAPAQIDPAVDLALAVDCSSPDRLGALLGVAERSGVFAVLDHHASNAGFGDICVVQPGMSSTGELVAGLLDRLGMPLSAGVADNIYAAISSDTGSFRFGSTTADTHRLAARLQDAGVDHSPIAGNLFAGRPLPVARLAAETVAAAVHEPSAAGGAGALIGTVSRADRQRLTIGYDDVESLVSDLAAVGDVDVAVLAKQTDTGQWKVSMRSKGRLDVGQLAADHGGGGHLQAAGYTAEPPLEQVVAELRRALDLPGYRC